MQNQITRRDFIKAGAGGLCALALGGQLARAADPAKKPNILIITTDQQQVGILSALGNKWVKTPNMDSIVANGVFFKKSYCPYPLCSPSRASLHTSRMPHEMGVDRNDVPIDPSIPVLGQLFRDAGYDTGYSGKWHLPDAYPNADIAGFEVLNKATRTRRLARDVDSDTAAQGIEFLQRKRDKPFLLVTSFINPHDICLLAGANPLSGEVEKIYMPAEGAELPPLPANHAFIADEPGPVARKRMGGDVKTQFSGGWDETHWRRYLYAYYRLTEEVDKAVGRVLEALRASGQEENTIVIFTADHGDGMGAHDWTGKMMFYEEEAAVPLIVSWKGRTPAGRIDADHLVSGLDVLPTLCDYAGVQPPAIVRGTSLRPVIEKPEQPGSEFVVSEMVLGGGGPGVGARRDFMVRTKKYKYIVFPGAEHAEMLFDLEADPGEMKNLAGDPALAGEMERHRKLLEAWNAKTEADKHAIVAAPKAGKKKAARQKADPAAMKPSRLAARAAQRGKAGGAGAAKAGKKANRKGAQNPGAV